MRGYSVFTIWGGERFRNVSKGQEVSLDAGRCDYFSENDMCTLLVVNRRSNTISPEVTKIPNEF